MRFPWKDARHLVSLLVLLGVAIGLFVLLRAAVVPAGFGRYGHYRAGAIDDNRARALAFAGQGECVYCHDTQVEARQAGKHRIVSCEACHGPQAKHAASDGKLKPVRPEINALCLNCHEKDSAKTAAFPQVARADHYADSKCNDCHQPHKPKM